ncbi:SdrD B-like domain-containing protein [Nostoc piscinale]|uniref:SdrD B-like domain-containing protein n=1 Tax=Nostoc piscinale TaxID=224012 RepID=UPI001F3A7834|nr:SdrD B-like domain-containing protein [Nostoc piscinale]
MQWLNSRNYQVRFTAPTGYVFSAANQGNDDALDSDANPSTGITQTVTLTSGEFNGTLDAGLVALASLGNFVFEDKNANGIQDAGESGISNATVNLLNAAGNVIATTTTDGNGLYSFTNLQPGDYRVQFVQPNGFNGISPQNVGGNDAIDSDGLTSDTVNLSPGENDTTVDAGFYKTAALGDFVFNDANNNGIQDTGEVGVGGVTVTLTGGGADGIINGIGDTTVTTTTNASGNYNFTGLTPGQQYRVGFSGLPAGFQFTQANVGANDAVDSDADPGTGQTQIVTLVSGENNLTLDAGLIKNIGDLSITKTDGLTTVVPGQQITYTIVARNNGLITATNALVSDIIPSNLTNVTWTSVASGGATDNQTSGTGNINDYVTLTAGSSITYTVTGTVAPSAVSTGSLTTFDFNGNSALDGTDGNTRTFTKDGITVTAKAFSRVDGTNGAWSAAYLGSYGGGLGVTDSSEGDGGNNTHVVDNVGGRDNYVLFQFSEAVVLDKAYLQYVLQDSDISVWIGNFSSPLTTLNDSVLSSFGFYEVNVTTSSSDRWADVNASNYVGNTIVIAALDTDTSPEDQFKIRHLDVLKPIPASLINTATITPPSGFTDTNPNNNTATDTDTVIAAPGVRTPGFWANTEWQKFWDGIQGNEPSQKTLANFADSDLLFPSYTNSAQSGKVLDPVTGQYNAGLLIGDYNRNGKTDAGENTIFYTLSQARQIVDSSSHPNGDVRYDLGRSLVASWLNYLAGNPIDTANTSDKDARYYINEGINWLQAVTPDENGDKKGDGALNQLTGSSVNSPRIDNYWSQGISSASNLPSPYNSNTNVIYPLDAGSLITSKLDDYNNGLGLADHVFYGGNA